MGRITAIVITKNEEAMIANCLDTLQWCEQVLVVDSGSTDSTVMLADRSGAKVIELKQPSFAESRNEGLKHANGEWVLYVDADERVTPALKQEIEGTIETSPEAAFSIPRNNIHYGKWMRHGGWQKDVVVRLFRKSNLEKWEGRVHEHAVVRGTQGALKEPLIHLTHRNMKDGLQKSIVWTDIEARLLLDSGHPKITPLRLIKVTVWEFVKRMIKGKAYLDGSEGMIEAMVQAMNRFLVYERLWELQRKPSLESTYERIEKEIHHLWKKENA